MAVIDPLSELPARSSSFGSSAKTEGVYPARVDGSLASRGAAANDVNMLSGRGGLSPLTARLVSAVGLALAVFLAVRLLSVAIARVTAALFLRPIDRIAGIGLGLAEGTALLGLALAAVLRVAPASPIGHVIETSPVAHPLLQVAIRIVDVARPYTTAARESI